MRLIVFLAAIAVLFALADGSAAQTAYAATVATAASPQAPSARAAGLRLLTWPGKVEPSRPRAPARTAPAQIVSAAPPGPVQAPAHSDWDPASRAPQQATPQEALPASIYAPLPPRAAPAAAAQSAPTRAMTQAATPADGDYLPPHFYSVHRQYGETPDPIPLNPQFFATSTPDLAQPPPPVPHTVTTSSGRVVQSASPSPDDSPG